MKHQQDQLGCPVDCTKHHDDNASNLGGNFYSNTYNTLLKNTKRVQYYSVTFQSMSPSLLNKKKK